MKRRDFITLLGAIAASAVLPNGGFGQQPARAVIGFLRPTSAGDSERLVAAWREGLKAGGYVEGQNITVEYRWGENHFDRLPALAADLVSHKVAVIVAAGNEAAHVAKAATANIPIVFAVGEDPVKTGLVSSLNRPGGNITGATFITLELAKKKLQLLSELTPKSRIIAFLVNPKNPQTELELNETQTAALSLGRRIIVVRASAESDIEKAVNAVVEQHADCLIIPGDAFFFSQRNRFIALAAHHSIPVAYQWLDAVTTGGLMSYGPSLPGAYRQAGLYVGKILQGASPGDLPIQQPTKFEFAINLKVAKTLGLVVPPDVISIADEVIE